MQRKDYSRALIQTGKHSSKGCSGEYLAFGRRLLGSPLGNRSLGFIVQT